MTVRKARDIEKSLIRKGFKQEPRDHRFFVLYIDGKRSSVNTHTSHCGQEINDYLIDCMKKQLSLTKKQFLDLIDCPLSYEEYIQILRDLGRI